MNTESRIAVMYAKEMVTFIMREHNLNKWQPSSLLSQHFCNESLKSYFHQHVSWLIVALAKGSEKNILVEMGPVLLQKVTTCDVFERFARNFATSYFDQFGCNQLSILKVFTYIIEFSILCYLENSDMADAPEVAIRVIAQIFLKTDRGSFIKNGGLWLLNHFAKTMKNEPGNGYSKWFCSERLAW